MSNDGISHVHVHRADEPHDRLTFLTAEMTTPLDRPENEDVRAIVMLDTDDDGAIQMHGWDSPAQAIAALIMHLQAMGAAYGIDFQMVGIPNSPEGL